jgi:hypothetical protein
LLLAVVEGDLLDSQNLFFFLEFVVVPSEGLSDLSISEDDVDSTASSLFSPMSTSVTEDC